jgi:hypothetical protein
MKSKYYKIFFTKLLDFQLRTRIRRLTNRCFTSKIDRINRIKYRYHFAMSYYRPQIKQIKKWIWRDTENSNFYYDLTEDNELYLATLISNITGTSTDQVLDYFAELKSNVHLSDYIKDNLKESSYPQDIEIMFGRRIGWYAFVRILKPEIVVETGVDHGIGSCVLIEAIKRNIIEGSYGKYFGTDLNPSAGQLIKKEDETLAKILYGDSITSLKAFDKQIDLFINDSDHSSTYEYDEYQSIKSKLNKGAVILGDNSHVSRSLCRFSLENLREFYFFGEKPSNHWYPGAGIGISVNRQGN